MMDLFTYAASLPQAPAIPGLSAPPKPQNPPAASPAKSVDLMGLTRTSCRWPMTDAAPWLFCGEKAKRGAFCKEHAAQAYRGKAAKAVTL